MNLKEIAASLGIGEYPEILEEIYGELDLSSLQEFNEKALRELERDYEILGEFYGDVLSGAKALFEDKELCTWVLLLCEYVRRVPKSEFALPPYPEKEGAAADMMRIFPLLSLARSCAALYADHGFSEKEIKDIFKVFRISLRLSAAAVGRPAFTKTYYSWTRVYLHCEMFDYGSFNFQFRKFPTKAVLLENKNSGEFVLLPTEGRFHKSGRTLGDIGFTDEDGAFDAEYSETDTEFIGHPAENNVFSPEKSSYSKREWQIALTSEDYVISLHIPRNVDFSDEAIEDSLEVGAKIARERFPEYDPKFIMCSSWLLDPTLESLLGENSRIVKFGKRFMRYSPAAAASGFGGFSFVFLGYSETNIEALPEDTGLRRKLKAHYLSGGHTHFYPGIITKRY